MPLAELRRFLGGEKATLLWDGLPSHRSRAMRAWLATQRHWLVVERLPAYAPEQGFRVRSAIARDLLPNSALDNPRSCGGCYVYRRTMRPAMTPTNAE